MSLLSKRDACTPKKGTESQQKSQQIRQFSVLFYDVSRCMFSCIASPPLLPNLAADVNAPGPNSSKKECFLRRPRVAAQAGIQPLLYKRLPRATLGQIFREKPRGDDQVCSDNNHPMKEVDFDEDNLADCVDFRFLDSASPSQIEAVCLYEYMRESQTLRDALNAATDERKRRTYGLLSPFFLSFSSAQFVRLMRTLQHAGCFPKPWKALSNVFQKKLRSLLAGSTKRIARRDKKRYPPLIIENAGIGENADGRLEVSEPILLQRSRRRGRRYFYGFVQIDRSYNERDLVEAFRKAIRKRWSKTRGGNRERWRARLRNLAVMRIRKNQRNQWKRLELVAEFCSYKGCVREAAAYKKRCKEGRGDEPMSEAAKVQMSSARSEARTFFQSLFPTEEPLSY